MSSDIEIEAKYLVHADPNWLQEQVIQFFHENAFSADSGSLHLQNDVYYDTADQALLRNGMVLRLRHKGGKRYITFKKALTKGASAQGRPWERFERERETADPEIEGADNKAFIKQCFSDFAGDNRFIAGGFEKIVTIRNKRQRYTFANATSAYEAAFDNVTYISELTKKECSERQLEIEKLTDETPVESMRVLIRNLERKLGDGIEPCWESKYERACKMGEEFQQ
jgi:inorganic triphosphatase YgiF